MISEQLKELIRPAVLVQKIIWFVIVGSIIFYIGFVYIFLGGNKALTSPVSGDMDIFIYLLAGAAFVGSILYHRYSLSDKKLKQFLSKDVDLELLAKDPRTKKIDTGKLGKLNSLPVLETKIYSLMFELQKITILSLILNELIVIFGSAIAFMNEDVSKIVPFGIISPVLCFWMFPRAQAIIKRAEQLISTNE